jgi:hypothetical protein
MTSLVLTVSLEGIDGVVLAPTTDNDLMGSKGACGNAARRNIL